MKRTSIALALGAAATLFAAPALADDAKVQPGASAGLLLGYGTEDLFKLGVGVRAGYTLPQTPVYIGGTFIYHFGTSEDLGPAGSATVNVIMLGAEGGYDLAAGPVIVRPYLGIGMGFAKAAVPGGSVSDNKVYFSPGGTVLYALNQQWSVGGDARIVFISDANDFSLMATGAYHF
jgi:hypothetical protein